jgi:ketosteroid isomerase-like protein
MTTKTAGHSSNRDTIIAYFDLLMARDIDAWGELWAEDGKQENPFAPDGILSTYPDKKFILDWYKKTFKNRREHKFMLDHIHETTDPDTIIVEARATSIIGEINKLYEQRYVFVFKFRDGRIILNREYFNPLAYIKAWEGVTINAKK